MPIPDAIANAPEVETGLEFYLQAFLDLDSSRSLGLSMGPIPWTAINEWAKRHEVEDQEDFDDLVYMVSRLDAQWVVMKNGKS